MPVYEYSCARSHHYEKMEGFDAPVEQQCPQCGEPSRRLLSLPAVIFKGPGFYSTDNPKDGQRRKESTDDKKITDRKKGSDGKESAEKKESPTTSDSAEPTEGASV